MTVVVDAADSVVETTEGNNAARFLFGEPPAPTSLAVFGDASTGWFHLSWDLPDGEQVVRCDVFRAVGAGGPAELVGSTTGTSFVDYLARPGEEYFYSVVAVDSYGVPSPASEEASDVIPPGLDIRPAAGQLVVSWPNPSTRFVLQRSAAGMDLFRDWSDVPGSPLVAGEKKEATVPPDEDLGLYRLIGR
jgi:hypothetical protein